MSQNTRKEVLEKMSRRYQNGGPEHRKKLIDDAVELFGYHRKSGIRRLAAKPVRPAEKPLRIGRPQKYDSAWLLPALESIWLSGQQPCGKRLASMVPEWVPAFEAYHRSVSSGVRERLAEASAATLDRLLRPCRIEHGKGRSGTKPGTLLRQSIPIRGGSWEENQPGWTEADTVSLCGGLSMTAPVCVRLLSAPSRLASSSST